MTYKPNRDGIRELGRSAGVQEVAMEGARVVRDRAAADDRRGTYEVQPAIVSAGRGNEARTGAAVVETVRGLGAFRRTLARAVEGR